MKRLLILIMLAMLGALPSIASAQEPPSLRAAPPPEPDVLRAATDAGAVAQESRDIAGRWTGGFDAAVQSLAKSGGTLTNIVTGKFDGLSKSIAIADAASTLGAASAGDVRGTVSGAAAIAVGGNVTAGGAALFGEIGTVAGGAIGSFFPVIGNIAGSIVGGAVGTAAGGFICAFGYDKYVKDYVAKGVTGIVSVFDTAPLTQAMEAKRAFLWATMAPEERAQLQGLQTGRGDAARLRYAALCPGAEAAGATNVSCNAIAARPSRAHHRQCAGRRAQVQHWEDGVGDQRRDCDLSASLPWRSNQRRHSARDRLSQSHRGNDGMDVSRRPLPYPGKRTLRVRVRC